jgi:hypothetical protein
MSNRQPSTTTYDGLANFAGMSPIPRGNICNSDSLIAFKDDSGDSSVGAKKEVMLNVHDAVDVCYAKNYLGPKSANMQVCLTGGGITSPSGVSIDVLGPDFGAMRCVQVCRRYQ